MFAPPRILEEGSILISIDPSHKWVIEEVDVLVIEHRFDYNIKGVAQVQKVFDTLTVEQFFDYDIKETLNSGEFDVDEVIDITL